MTICTLFFMASCYKEEAKNLEGSYSCMGFKKTWNLYPAYEIFDTVYTTWYVSHQSGSDIMLNSMVFPVDRAIDGNTYYYDNVTTGGYIFFENDTLYFNQRTRYMTGDYEYGGEEITWFGAKKQ